MFDSVFKHELLGNCQPISFAAQTLKLKKETLFLGFSKWIGKKGGRLSPAKGNKGKGGSLENRLVGEP